jgi:hypothetical protein
MCRGGGRASCRADERFFFFASSSSPLFLCLYPLSRPMGPRYKYLDRRILDPIDCTLSLSLSLSPLLSLLPQPPIIIRTPRSFPPTTPPSPSIPHHLLSFFFLFFFLSVTFDLFLVVSTSALLSVMIFHLIRRIRNPPSNRRSDKNFTHLFPFCLLPVRPSPLLLLLLLPFPPSFGLSSFSFVTPERP